MEYTCGWVQVCFGHTHLPTHARSIRKPLWVVLVCFGCTDPPVHHPLETWYGTSYTHFGQILMETKSVWAQAWWLNCCHFHSRSAERLMCKQRYTPISLGAPEKVSVPYQLEEDCAWPVCIYHGQCTCVQTKPDDVICVRSLYCQVQSNMWSSIYKASNLSRLCADFPELWKRGEKKKERKKKKKKWDWKLKDNLKGMRCGQHEVWASNCECFIFWNGAQVLTLDKCSSKYTTNLVKGFYAHVRFLTFWNPMSNLLLREKFYWA